MSITYFINVFILCLFSVSDTRQKTCCAKQTKLTLQTVVPLFIRTQFTNFYIFLYRRVCCSQGVKVRIDTKIKKTHTLPPLEINKTLSRFMNRRICIFKYRELLPNIIYNTLLPGNCYLIDIESCPELF